MSKKILVLSMIVLSVLLSSCEPAITAIDQKAEEIRAEEEAEKIRNIEMGVIYAEKLPVEGVSTYGVFRMVDPDARVVCWIYVDGASYQGQGGMSCLPLSETALTNYE